MIDVEKVRKDFPAIGNTLVKGKEMIYFDNSATLLKPQCVIDTAKKYFDECFANPHGEDYEVAQKSFKEYCKARDSVAKLLNAESDEISFTCGATGALNAMATMLKQVLHEGDEVIISIAEHASNVLPWFELQKHFGIKVRVASLDKDGRCTLETIKKVITDKTKIISIAQVTNVMGYIIDVKEIGKYAHEHDIIMCVDAAQAAPHIKIDVKDIDCDFLAISGHKLGAPTGIGALYAKKYWLEKLDPYQLGGGMNARFSSNGEYSYTNIPGKFEAGSQNVLGAMCLGTACEYLMSIGLDNIAKREYELKQYAVKALSKVKGVSIYNAKSEAGIIAFNKDGVFSQDLGTHLSTYGVCVRSGHHCAKMLPEYLNVYSTVRASLSFYNTEKEIDKFVEAVSKGDDFLDAFFK